MTSPDKDRVPICGTRGLTVSRAIWDEAWIAYVKRYGSGAQDRQHARLLAEGFYASELDDLRPGWRPIDQRIAALEGSLAEANRVWSELSALVACSSPDGSAELGQVKHLQERFANHTNAVADFLNELYAIMVDPCAEGTTSVEDVKAALKAAALRDRERSASPATHFAIEHRGLYFCALDIGTRPPNLVWSPPGAVNERRPAHVFQTKVDAEEIMKLCPPGSEIVPVRVELGRSDRAASNDSEGGALD